MARRLLRERRVPIPPATSRRERLLVFLSRWRVDVGLIVGVPALLLARPTLGTIAEFAPLVVMGVLLRTWARGHLERGIRVAERGPYALMRHPLYLGSFLIGVGITLMAHVPYLPSAFVVIFLAMYVPKALREEAFLRRRFGQSYADYATRVGPLWPRRLGGAAAATAHGERFAWRQVMANGEWKTWLGVAAVLIYLLVVVRAAPARIGSGGHDRQPRADGSP